MLTVYTSTFCRPDLVDLVSRAVRVTCAESVRFVAYVHAGGIERKWDAVDHVVRTGDSGYNAQTKHRPEPPWLYIHDDCVPMSAWNSSAFPAGYCTRNDAGSTLIYFDGVSKFKSPAPLIPSRRIASETDCPALWGSVSAIAADCQVESLMQGTFLHIDKSTIAHPDSPANARKRELVESIAAHLGFAPPEPLSPTELRTHTGRRDWPRFGGRSGSLPSFAERAANFAASAAKHIAAGMPRASDEEIERRFAICQGCEHYDGRACTECGCPIMRERQFLSKLSWAGESCPAGKWGPVSS